MKEYFHYTLEKNLSSIRATGVFGGDSNFTTDNYYNAREAGDRLGIQAHYIDCVFKFADDGRFKNRGIVPFSNRASGGGTQFSHPGRPKPIAIRLIGDRQWRMLS